MDKEKRKRESDSSVSSLGDLDSSLTKKISIITRKKNRNTIIVHTTDLQLKTTAMRIVRITKQTMKPNMNSTKQKKISSEIKLK